MVEYYYKEKKDLTALDKLRLLNGGFHRINEMIGTPGAVEQNNKRRNRR